MSATTRELTCIVCPRGCHLVVTLEGGVPTAVTGNACPRGAAYAEAECTHPVRTLTSTVRVADGRVLAVKTNAPIPKEKLFEAMADVNRVVAPVSTKEGDVLLPHICGTDADLVATEDA